MYSLGPSGAAFILEKVRIAVFKNVHAAQEGCGPDKPLAFPA